jgi:hypothetical protein
MKLLLAKRFCFRFKIKLAEWFILQLCQLSVRIFNATVREVLLAVGGYEAKEVGGLALVAFNSPKVALEWALALQLALLMVSDRKLVLLAKANLIKCAALSTRLSSRLNT